MDRLILKIFNEKGFTTGMAISVFIILVLVIWRILKQQEQNTIRAEKREDDYVEIIKSLRCGLQNLLDEIKNFKNDSFIAHKFNRNDFTSIKESISKESENRKEEHKELAEMLKTINEKL